MIWHETTTTQENRHLPPWRVGVCLFCQHCFDHIEHMRCPLCHGSKVAPLETIAQNWHKFRKGAAVA